MDESIEVVPSEENGNVPIETPNEQPTEPVVPTESVPTEPVAPTEPELLELPDGRKVEPRVVVEEYKSLLTDYTKKSQELALAKKGDIINNNEPSQNPYADPEYVPQSYEEILRVAEERAIKAIEAKELAKIEEQQAIENQVVSQLEEVKKLDPNVNENALFIHANKYGFRDLSVAYQNMKDMNQIVKSVQKTTADNIAKRNDPVSITPGATGQRPDPSQFSNAVEYMRSLK